MISFRKHAAESTRRPDSLLRRRRPFAEAAKPRFAALLMLLLAAAAGASAAPRQRQPRRERPKSVERAAAAAAQAQATTATAEEPTGEPVIPVRVTRVETPDGPGVVATIGDFPSDLNEAGQEFLKREFFEHFARDVLGLADAGARATLKVAMLPQERENQREGDFTSGKVSGHIIVLVERRRVFVACTFSEAERKPSLLASAGRFAAGVFAAE